MANGGRGGQSGNGNHVEPYCSTPRGQEWREGRCKEANELETRFGGKMQSKSGVRLPCLEFWVPQLGVISYGAGYYLCQFTPLKRT